MYDRIWWNPGRDVAKVSNQRLFIQIFAWQSASLSAWHVGSIWGGGGFAATASSGHEDSRKESRAA